MLVYDVTIAADPLGPALFIYLDGNDPLLHNLGEFYLPTSNTKYIYEKCIPSPSCNIVSRFWTNFTVIRTISTPIHEKKYIA